MAGVVAWSSSADVLVIDMEIAYWQPTGEWLVEEVVHEAIAEAKARGFRVLLYTASWVTNFWAVHLGHMPRFDCDGIYARYDGVPVIQQPEGPHCLTEGHSWIGKQYGGQNLDGVEIDLNVFDSNWFEQEEDWMAQLSDGAIANMEKFFGQTDLLLDGSYGRFIQEQGQPAIYLLLVSQTSWGTGIRVTRHACPNPETFALLGGQWDGVNIISAAQMAKILLGKPLPDLS